MKKLVAFAFMTVFMLAMTVTANAAGKKVQTSRDVNLRKGPGLNYAVTTSVKKGTVMNYMGTTKADSRGVNWFKVSYKNKTNWVSSRYASFTQTKTRQVKATAEVNLRQGPGLNYKASASVKKGTKLTYLNQSKTDSRGVNWHKVSYKGKALWISSRYAVFA